MSKQPTCPSCGGHTFTLPIQQLVEVEFLPNDEHRITDGPSGDMEWGDDSFAICADCGEGYELKDLS